MITLQPSDCAWRYRYFSFSGRWYPLIAGMSVEGSGGSVIALGDTVSDVVAIGGEAGLVPADTLWADAQYSGYVCVVPAVGTLVSVSQHAAPATRPAGSHFGLTGRRIRVACSA